MDSLWILTEEKPKVSVIKTIIKTYCKDFDDTVLDCKDVNIVPTTGDQGKFLFSYDVNGYKLKKIQFINILTVSGNSSFFDFLVVRQSNPPIGNYCGPNVLMAIEETKTSDDESRNTGVYQRASKFVFIDIYFKSIRKYMLYNDELMLRADKVPSDTSIFGTNMLLTQSVEILGKGSLKWFKPFTSLNELITFKNSMRKPPAGNVPINIKQAGGTIFVSGRLEKPIGSGNINHDPNIGALSCICKTIRVLGWKNEIVITNHGVSQGYINRARESNKFLSICRLLDVKLHGLTLPNNITFPENYWHYEKSSEKIASILLHIVAENSGLLGIYQNHAGCERGYFKSPSNPFIVLPKLDKSGNNLFIPDLILLDSYNKEVILIEGKKLETIGQGLVEINNYCSIENEYIRPNYPNYRISKWLTIFGGNEKRIPHDKVLLYLNQKGEIILNTNAPKSILLAFNKTPLFLKNYIK